MDITGTNSAALRLAVDLVNAQQCGQLDDGWVQAATRVLTLPVLEPPDDGWPPALLPVLDALATDLLHVFEAGTATEAASRVNVLLAPHALRLSVSVHDGLRPHLHFDHAGQDAADRVRVNLLAALAGVLCDPSGQFRLGRCAADHCARVFVDASRAARQRFCSPACASRTHVAGHRARARSVR